MTVAMIALFVALSGTAVATTSALITGKQIKNSSITGADVKNRSLTPRDFRGSVRGPQGLRGLTGATGATGAPGPVGQIQGAPAGGDLTGTYPNPTIGAGKVTSSSIFDGTIAAVDLAGSLSDAAAATPSLRSLGTGASQAAAGNDPRLADARPPTGAVPGGGDLTGSYPSPTIANGSVTAAKINAPVTFTSAGLANAFPACANGDMGPLGNAWGTVSPNVNNVVGYARDAFGIVRLRGIALRCGTVGNPIFTLPSGFRPGSQEIQLGAHSSGAASVRRLFIDAGGAVGFGPDALPASDEWVSLDGITFRCGPSGANGCP